MDTPLDATRAAPGTGTARHDQPPTKDTDPSTYGSVPDDGVPIAAVLIDPAAEVELRRQLAREAAADAYERGLVDGAAAQAASYKRRLLGMYDDARLEALRWTVLCRDCRRNGRRESCTRCEVRDRETFGLPHPDDHIPAISIRLEAAS